MLNRVRRLECTFYISKPSECWSSARARRNLLELVPVFLSPSQSDLCGEKSQAFRAIRGERIAVNRCTALRGCVLGSEMKSEVDFEA